MTRNSVLIALTLLWFCPSLASSQASAYIPLDHWAMPHIEHLIRAGVIIDPDPSTRPFRRGMVASALRSLDDTLGGSATASLISDLLAEFHIPDSVFSGGFDPSNRIRG
jgi:hypothetical protein